MISSLINEIEESISTSSIVTSSSIDKYRFQYMDYKKRVVFRYDNAPHYSNISTFPLHKHSQDGKVVESTVPKFHEILEEITAFIAQSP